MYEKDSEIYALFTRFKHDFTLLNFLFQSPLCPVSTHVYTQFPLLFSHILLYGIASNAAKVFYSSYSYL